MDATADPGVPLPTLKHHFRLVDVTANLRRPLPICGCHCQLADDTANLWMPLPTCGRHCQLADATLDSQTSLQTGRRHCRIVNCLSIALVECRNHSQLIKPLWDIRLDCANERFNFFHNFETKPLIAPQPIQLLS